MATLFTPTTEFVLVVDGLETVTLQTPGTAVETSLASCKRRAISTKEVEASNGKYTKADVHWHIPYGSLAAPPDLGSTIVDSSSVEWTILEVDRMTRNTRWRCTCRDLAVFYDLDSEIKIQRATWTRSKHGAAERTWVDWREVRARIQPQGDAVAIEHDMRVSSGMYRITIAEDLDVDENMQVKGPDGTIYRITGYEGRERLDVLPVILARKASVDWPLATV